MTTDAAAAHPSPQRRSVGLPILAFGLTGAPLAWIGLSLINYSVASEGCATSQASGGARTVLAIAAVLALAVSAAALWFSYESWRRTFTEHQGAQQQALEVGEGRTRFLALCGIIISIGFIGGIVFAVLPLLLVPSCGA